MTALPRILKRFTSSTHRSVHPSAFLGYRPLTVFIVPQTLRFVNTFFEISQTFFGKGVALLRPSVAVCHPRQTVPSTASLVYYLYSGEVGRPKPLWGKEWRLYKSYTHLCDLLLTHLRRVTSVHPACKRSPPYCIFIIPQRGRFVKTFFKLFSSFFHLAFWRLAPSPLGQL